MTAKEVIFQPTIRVIVPTGGCGNDTELDYANKLALMTLMEWTKEEILEWILDSDKTIINSKEKYDSNYDTER
jgi:hypothetical protein